jgi:tetratricopeptide (TPR) repeat protein
MRSIPAPRRFLIAGVSLTAALVLFHAQLAAAIVTRGDDALRAGDANAAMGFYARAARLDPGSSVAADRLAFYLALRHDRPSALQAIAVASEALAATHGDPSLFADRAFAELQLRNWRAAERDFAAAGLLGRDARYEHFAGRMALRNGDRRAAERYARLALSDDRRFAPARALLRTLR